jgi:hypothetical protein
MQSVIYNRHKLVQITDYTVNIMKAICFYVGTNLFHSRLRQGFSETLVRIYQTARRKGVLSWSRL